MSNCSISRVFLTGPQSFPPWSIYHKQLYKHTHCVEAVTQMNNMPNTKELVTSDVHMHRLYKLYLQAVLFTWGWWLERSSGEGCQTRSAADSASSSACPPTASSPSCRRLSRDMASFSSAVSLQASGKSHNEEVILGLMVMAGRYWGRTAAALWDCKHSLPYVSRHE